MVGVVPYSLRIALAVLDGDELDSALIEDIQPGKVLLCDRPGVGPIKEHRLNNCKVNRAIARVLAFLSLCVCALCVCVLCVCVCVLCVCV